MKTKSGYYELNHRSKYMEIIIAQIIAQIIHVHRHEHFSMDDNISTDIKTAYRHKNYPRKTISPLRLNH